MAEAVDCELDLTSCPVEAPPEIELYDRSILPETDAGPVLAEPPRATDILTLITPDKIDLLKQYFTPLDNIHGAAAAEAAASAADANAVTMRLQSYANEAIRCINLAHTYYKQNDMANAYKNCLYAIGFATTTATDAAAATANDAVSAITAAEKATIICSSVETTFTQLVEAGKTAAAAAEAAKIAAVEKAELIIDTVKILANDAWEMFRWEIGAFTEVVGAGRTKEQAIYVIQSASNIFNAALVAFTQKVKAGETEGQVSVIAQTVEAQAFTTRPVEELAVLAADTASNIFRVALGAYTEAAIRLKATPKQAIYFIQTASNIFSVALGAYTQAVRAVETVPADKTARQAVFEALEKTARQAVFTAVEARAKIGGEALSATNDAIQFAKQNSSPDLFYAASAAAVCIASISIITRDINLFTRYHESAINAFNAATNPVTNTSEVLLNNGNYPIDFQNYVQANTGTDPLTYCFNIMDYIEELISKKLLNQFNVLFDDIRRQLLVAVTILRAGRYKGFVGITRCGFLSKYTTVIYYAGHILYEYRNLISDRLTQLNSIINETILLLGPEVEEAQRRGVSLTCKFEKSNLQYDTQKIILCIKCASSHNIIQIPILNVVGFPVYQDVNPLIGLVTPPSLPCFLYAPPTPASPQFLSLLDIIVRAILCEKQGPIIALSEPSKEEVMLILSCFEELIKQRKLPDYINRITQAMHTILYTDANIKPFALFCNIFYNFINVSLGHRSLAKIIYSDFLGTSDNYGKVIRACQVVNSLPIMRENVKFFLTGSNAARVYIALNRIIKLVAPISAETIAPILNGTFGKLSDKDFMIYLKNHDSEPYRVFIRMILGGSFYFFKNLFDDTTTRRFTLEMIQSVGIVGFMDHLFAQRFDAKCEFLRRCYGKDTDSFLAQIYPSMAGYFENLDKQIIVAELDGVFKEYNLVRFYAIMLHIFKIVIPPGELQPIIDFLINKATSIDCIATVWTLVLNVLYTLFVPENCLARIVVGKFDNDPKNLILYMEILNDHLNELRTIGYSRSVIDPLVELQTYIATMCQTSITTGDRLQRKFKETCDAWVSKMVEMAALGPDGQGLFMLSVSDAIEIRRGHGYSTKGHGYSTKLERALCLAYLPTAQGNICSAASSLPQSSPFFGQISSVLNGHMLYDPFIEVTTRSKITDVSEAKLHKTLGRVGSLISVCLEGSRAFNIVPKPYVSNKHISVDGQVPSTPWPLSTYLNDHWKHLTKTAIDLKIFFKENLTDIKRVTGIKYIALVLGGYFQVRLLVDDVHEQCRVDKRVDLESFKTSQEMMACKRGLLPLLQQNPLTALIRDIVELDIQSELSHAAAHATATAVVGITPKQYAAAAVVGITPEQYDAAFASAVASAAAIGITPEQYAAVASAAAIGITPEQYAAAAAAIGITPEQYAAAASAVASAVASAAAIGITPEQYAAAAAAAALGITPERYIRATNYTAAIATVLKITPQQYDAVVAVGITPQQYSAAVALGVTTAQYSALAALGITPREYSAAVDLRFTPKLYAKVAEAFDSGVTTAQYSALAALGITTQQYSAAVDLRFTPKLYAKVAEAFASGVTTAHYSAVAALGITPEQYSAVAAAVALSIVPDLYNSVTAFAYTTIYAIAYNSSYKAYYTHAEEIKGNRNVAAGICFQAAATAVSDFNTQGAIPAYQDMYSAAHDAYIAAIANIISRILKILGFFFSIKVKSSSPHSPYQLLRLEDSILNFPFREGDINGRQILNPEGGMFIEFLKALDIDVKNRAIMKCICRSKGEVGAIDKGIYDEALENPLLEGVYTAVGGSNDSESNSGRNSVSSLNKHNHKYKHNKLARNNRTHRNKNKRKKNSKSKSHKPKPKSKPKSKSKSKSKSGKSKRKNVTFKRRKRSNRH
jgi:hypothetical protein